MGSLISCVWPPLHNNEALLTDLAGKPLPSHWSCWRTWDIFNRAQQNLADFEAQARDAARTRLAYLALLAKVDEVNPEPGEENQLKPKRAV